MWIDDENFQEIVKREKEVAINSKNADSGKNNNQNAELNQRKECSKTWKEENSVENIIKSSIYKTGLWIDGDNVQEIVNKQEEVAINSKNADIGKNNNQNAELNNKNSQIKINSSINNKNNTNTDTTSKKSSRKERLFYTAGSLIFASSCGLLMAMAFENINPPLCFTGSALAGCIALICLTIAVTKVYNNYKLDSIEGQNLNYRAK